MSYESSLFQIFLLFSSHMSAYEEVYTNKT